MVVTTVIWSLPVPTRGRHLIQKLFRKPYKEMTYIKSVLLKCSARVVFSPPVFLEIHMPEHPLARIN